MSFVSIVILNYKNWKETIECIDSVFKSNHRDFRVYVVDNNSGNRSLEEIVKWSARQTKADIPGPLLLTSSEFARLPSLSSLPSLVCIQNNENKGFAAGNNVALISLINEEGYIWLLNPDMVVLPDTMSAIIRFAGSNPANAIIGSVIRYQSNPDEIYMYGGGHVNFKSATIRFIIGSDSLDDLDYIGGGALFTHTSQFKSLGLLPENYFLYWEETDWCYAAKMKGHPMLVCPDAVCFDKIGTTIGRGTMAFFYYTRNGLLFVRKFKKHYIPLVLSLIAVRWAKSVIAGDRERARGIYQGAMAFMKTTQRETE